MPAVSAGNDPKPRRNRVASSRVTDGANGEAPSAAHQNVLATKPILDLIKRMDRLSAQLPDTVAEASDTDDVHRVITTLSGIDGSVAGTFNHRFDVLFGQECRDSDGRLKNIRRGDYGMLCVVEYLQSIHWESAGIPLDLAQLKLARIVEELEHIWSNHAKRTPEASAAAKGSGGSSISDPGPKKSGAKSTQGPAWEKMMDRE
ncbi:hypothetical protein B0H11DRAFT_1924246 [Mycena galericulata]|nr:hypothetical protein B0H11DRAFT_1924246 [Mycena galericulata]